jgi:hypothetical protein
VTPSCIGRAALAYVARLGWPVFPCWPRSKTPIAESGFLDASIDERQIAEWWTRYPKANIAVACDAGSRLLTVDVDPRDGGDEQLAELERAHGELPMTPLGLTGGSGFHYVFTRPQGVSFRGKLAKGIDIKANGYIIVPPSIHPSGRSYAWDAGRHPLETELADLPAWVLQRIIKYDARSAYGQPADDAAKSFLARAFHHAGWLGSRIDSVRVNCLCPWADQHTQQSGSGGTVLFAPRDGGGAGWFHCSHTSHGPKTLDDVIAVLPMDAVRKANADICMEAADRVFEDEERAAIRGDG